MCYRWMGEFFSFQIEDWARIQFDSVVDGSYQVIGRVTGLNPYQVDQ